MIACADDLTRATKAHRRIAYARVRVLLRTRIITNSCVLARVRSVPPSSLCLRFLQSMCGLKSAFETNHTNDHCVEQQQQHIHTQTHTHSHKRAYTIVSLCGRTQYLNMWQHAHVCIYLVYVALGGCYSLFLRWSVRRKRNGRMTHPYRCGRCIVYYIYIFAIQFR